MGLGNMTIDVEVASNLRNRDLGREAAQRAQTSIPSMSSFTLI